MGRGSTAAMPQNNNGNSTSPAATMAKRLSAATTVRRKLQNQQHALEEEESKHKAQLDRRVKLCVDQIFEYQQEFDRLRHRMTQIAEGTVSTERAVQTTQDQQIHVKQALKEQLSTIKELKAKPATDKQTRLLQAAKIKTATMNLSKLKLQERNLEEELETLQRKLKVFDQRSKEVQTAKRSLLEKIRWATTRRSQAEFQLDQWRGKVDGMKKEIQVLKEKLERMENGKDEPNNPSSDKPNSKASSSTTTWKRQETTGQWQKATSMTAKARSYLLHTDAEKASINSRSMTKKETPTKKKVDTPTPTNNKESLLWTRRLETVTQERDEATHQCNHLLEQAAQSNEQLASVVAQMNVSNELLAVAETNDDSNTKNPTTLTPIQEKALELAQASLDRLSSTSTKTAGQGDETNDQAAQSSVFAEQRALISKIEAQAQRICSSYLQLHAQYEELKSSNMQDEDEETMQEKEVAPPPPPTSPRRPSPRPERDWPSTAKPFFSEPSSLEQETNVVPATASTPLESAVEKILQVRQKTKQLQQARMARDGVGRRPSPNPVVEDNSSSSSHRNQRIVQLRQRMRSMEQDRTTHNHNVKAMTVPKPRGVAFSEPLTFDLTHQRSSFSSSSSASQNSSLEGSQIVLDDDDDAAVPMLMATKSSSSPSKKRIKKPAAVTRLYHKLVGK